MSTMNIYLSNSYVVMLKLPILLATAEFEFIYASVHVHSETPLPQK